MFLQAARNEAAKRKMEEQVGQLDSKLMPGFAKNEIEMEGKAALLMEEETVELFQAASHESTEPTEAEITESDLPLDALAKAKDAIARKQFEIDQTQQQLDRLLKIKAVVSPKEPMSGKASLNELRMKRLAIQMALVADSKEYVESDLLAIDRLIAEFANSASANQQNDSSSNSAESLRLNAKIEECQDRLQKLRDDQKDMIYTHNVRVAFRKAEEYILALKRANSIRHELLALAELLGNDYVLDDMKLGGELPIPSGFEPFDSLLLDCLTTTIDGIEEAKDRLQTEIIA
jgi:hypothetical protein